MARRRKIAWSPGDLFTVRLPDDTLALGQACELMRPGVAYCVLTSRRGARAALLESRPGPADVIAAVALKSDALDYADWPVIGYQALLVPRSEFANERLAGDGYKKATVYDVALAEEFLAAFHVMRPWDDWNDPHYLDGWLITPDRKPQRLWLRHRFRPHAGMIRQGQTWRAAVVYNPT